MNNNIVLAVDLGGTNMRMAAIGDDGTIFTQARTPTPKAGPKDLLDGMAALAAECRAALSAEMEIVGIGAGVPANIRPDGVLQNLPNLPSVEGMNLKIDLFDKLALPVTLENDATAAAIGENWLGASKDVHDSIMVTLGTGVGGGIIINNEPLRGPDGTAGKLGHICVEPDGHPCGCGSNGCIEQYASATAIVRLARESGLNVSTAYDVYKLATEAGVAAASADEVVLSDSALAQAVFNKLGRLLGITLAGLANALNPEMIIIGGGASAAFDAFIAPLTTEFHYRAFNEPAERAQITRAALTDNAGLLGAARSAFLNL